MNEDLATKYLENAKVAAVFFEWRHKLMTFTFAVTSALLVAFGWLLDHRASKWVAASPLFLAAAVSLAAVPITIRHGGILLDCYKRGENLETADGGTPGAYADLRKSRTARFQPSMTTVLTALYGLIGVSVLALAVLEVLFPRTFRRR
jgi:hypothetical protein